MNNKKLKIIIIVLTILTIGLTGYIIYDKITENDLSNVNNNDEQEEQNSTEDNIEKNEDIELNNNNKDNLNYDKETDNCDKDYKYVYADKYIYKIKIINPSGATVYDNYEKSEQNIIGKIDYGKEIRVVADKVDTNEFKKDYYNNFNEIENYYYFAIDVCGSAQYVKYTDVEIIDTTITNYNTFDKTTKFYIHEDEYLFNGPGLSFEQKNEDEKIPKGTILNVDKYISIGNGHWLYVNYNGKSGWILREYFNSVLYPYNSYKYGSAVSLDEEKGELYLKNEENLYKYAFSTDEIISKIPKGTKIYYDYSTSEPGFTYYHINYNDYSGWIRIIPYDENGNPY